MLPDAERPCNTVAVAQKCASYSPLLIAMTRETYGVELYEAVRPAVVNEGLSHREAARQFGIDRRTVKKMLSYSAPLGSGRARPIVPQKGFSGTRAMLEKAAGSRALSQVMC